MRRSTRSRPQIRFTPQFRQFNLKEDITPDELAFVESHRKRIAGAGHDHGAPTALSAQWIYGARHRLYVGEVSEDMLNSRSGSSTTRDVVGKSGVELQYNNLLMGKKWLRQVVVNSHGKEMGQQEGRETCRGRANSLS